MRFPKLAVVHAFNALPNFRFTAALVPASSEMPVIEPKHLRGEPGGNVNPIRYMSDGDLVLRLSTEQSGPHRAGYFTVQRGDCIRALRQSESKHGHAEQLVRIIGIFTP